MKNNKRFLYSIFIMLCSLALLNSCTKKIEKKPDPEVTALVIDEGAHMNFASWSGNKAIYWSSKGELVLDFIDTLNKAELHFDVLFNKVNEAIKLNTGLYPSNSAYITIGTNLPNQQDFCTCISVPGNTDEHGSGLLFITSLTSDHITGEFDLMYLFGTNDPLPAVYIYDGKFDLKLDRR